MVLLIEQAKANGEIDKAKDARELVEHIQIQIAGLRTFAKINSDKQLLVKKIETIFINYPF